MGGGQDRVYAGSVGGRGVLEGAFALLEAVESLEEAGLTRLAEDSGLPKTTAHRLLEQLIDLGAVERANVRGHYRMGPRLFQLGHGWQPYPGLKTAAAGPLRSLANATGTTVTASVLRNGKTLAVVGHAADTEPLVPVRPGATWPWSTAAGKLMVAAAQPGIPFGPLPGSWNQTAATIRDEGLAIDREEVLPGVFCLATPVFAPSGEVVAALGVLTGSPHRLRRLIPAAVRAAKIISGDLCGP